MATLKQSLPSVEDRWALVEDRRLSKNPLEGGS
jgi:hypothetical protein